MKEITFRHLLTHTSGLPRLPTNLDVHKNPLNPYAAYQTEQLYEYLRTYVPQPQPTEYMYSNLAYGLLGRIIPLRVPYIMELVGKKSLEQLIQEHVCRPLKMYSTLMKPSLGTAPDLKLVEAYVEQAGLKKDVAVPPWDQSVTAGAGALLSTIQDMFLFLEACIYPPESLRTVVEECQKVLYQSDKYRIGCGWFFKKASDGSVTCWHNGGTGGFSSWITFNRSAKSGVVILSNYADRERDIDSIGVDIMQFIMDGKIDFVPNS